MKTIRTVIALALALVTLSLPSKADIYYSLRDTSGHVDYVFDITTPDFVTSNRIFEPSALTYCGASGLPCTQVEFSSAFNYLLGIEVGRALIGNGTVTWFAYFREPPFGPSGLFTTLGAHVADFHTLFVSDTGFAPPQLIGPPIPEPAPYVLMMGGLLVVGVAMGFRRAAGLA